MTFQDLRDAVDQLIADANRISSIIDKMLPPAEKALEDYVVQYREYTYDHRTVPEPEYARPWRYLLKIEPIPQLSLIGIVEGIENNELIAALIHDGRTDIIDHLKALAKTCKNPTEFNEQLKPEYEKAQRIWHDRYPKRLRERLNDEYTVGQLALKILREGGETTTREVADVLGLNYDQVYHSDIRSRLAREGVKFVHNVKKT